MLDAYPINIQIVLCIPQLRGLQINLDIRESGYNKNCKFIITSLLSQAFCYRPTITSLVGLLDIHVLNILRTWLNCKAILDVILLSCVN